MIPAIGVLQKEKHGVTKIHKRERSKEGRKEEMGQ